MHECCDGINLNSEISASAGRDTNHRGCDGSKGQEDVTVKRGPPTHTAGSGRGKKNKTQQSKSNTSIRDIRWPSDDFK